MTLDPCARLAGYHNVVKVRSNIHQRFLLYYIVCQCHRLADAASKASAGFMNLSVCITTHHCLAVCMKTTIQSGAVELLRGQTVQASIDATQHSSFNHSVTLQSCAAGHSYHRRLAFLSLLLLYRLKASAAPFVLCFASSRIAA